MQGKVHVTAMSLVDWLTSPAPPPYDPSLTIESAAQHNAHLSFCEGVLVRLLDRLDKHGMTYPHELCGCAALCILPMHGVLQSWCTFAVEIGEWTDRS